MKVRPQVYVAVIDAALRFTTASILLKTEK
jgi:hypothetical protein